jgi:hypothetical protein
VLRGSRRAAATRSRADARLLAAISKGEATEAAVQLQIDVEYEATQVIVYPQALAFESIAIISVHGVHALLYSCAIT